MSIDTFPANRSARPQRKAPVTIDTLDNLATSAVALAKQLILIPCKVQYPASHLRPPNHRPLHPLHTRLTTPFIITSIHPSLLHRPLTSLSRLTGCADCGVQSAALRQHRLAQPSHPAPFALHCTTATSSFSPHNLPARALFAHRSRKLATASIVMYRLVDIILILGQF